MKDTVIISYASIANMDRKVLDSIVNHPDYKKLIRAYAYNYYKKYALKNTHVTEEDLQQEATLGLIKGLENFDATYDIAITSWVIHYIIKALMSYISANTYCIPLTDRAFMDIKRFTGAMDKLRWPYTMKLTNKEMEVISNLTAFRKSKILECQQRVVDSYNTYDINESEEMFFKKLPYENKEEKNFTIRDMVNKLFEHEEFYQAEAQVLNYVYNEFDDETIAKTSGMTIVEVEHIKQNAFTKAKIILQDEMGIKDNGRK